MNMFSTFRSRVKGALNQVKDWQAEKNLLLSSARTQEMVSRILADRMPRILVLKQDVNEDLYCCPPGSTAAEIVSSTLLRTGPVAFFSELNADFQIVATESDPECSIWQEQATILKWDSLEFFSSFRHRIPGRDYGQERWAVRAEDIDFGKYDIVVSIDICVPERISRRFPEVLWCYYVRELKCPSYARSLDRPLAGHDVVLNHCFRLRPPKLPAHVLEFPYHFQRPGCFHQLFGSPFPADEARNGVFVDHHTMVNLSLSERTRLSEFGPVASPIHSGEREIISTAERVARRTMDLDLRESLMNSRFFLITPGQRAVFGTALVEAISAGCLAIGSPKAFREHGYLFTSATAALDVNQSVDCMRRMASNIDVIQDETNRQRRLVEYTCFIRPLNELLAALNAKRKHDL
jgi:hypothetical protein